MKSGRKAQIAQFMQEVMLPDTLYIIGAGTTTEAIARYLGAQKNPARCGCGKERETHCAGCR